MVSGCIVIAFLLDRGGVLGFACLITEQSWCEHTLWCGIGVYLVCYVIACSSNCVIISFIYLVAIRVDYT